MLTEGASFGPYLVRHRLGAGGMGEVYLAFDSRLRRDVALKVLPPDRPDEENASARLIREARMASTLNHPNICTVFEAGVVDGRAFIAMERVEGEPLSAVIARGPMPCDRALRLGAQMADGIAHAHAKGVIHRDFKSANVFVTPDGRVRILDFGLATRVSVAHSGTVGPTESATPETAGGTLPYMAPELLRGGSGDARSDVWAFGVVLYEVATGHRPFDGRTHYELTSAILLNEAPALPSAVPRGLATIIRKCLSKEPGERYQRASEMKAALEAVGNASLQESAAVPVRRRFSPMLTAAGLAIVLAALVAGAIWRTRATPAHPLRTIAVLPLANLSPDSTQELFADGMTEALITDLARVKGIDVISHTSVMQYKNARKPLPQIARELSVDAVLEGSVLRAGDRVRITAQLIEAATDRHLWAEEYDRDVRDVLALQREVAHAVARQVRVTMSPGEAAAESRTRRIAPDAHDAYLKGRVLLGRLTEASIAQAISEFEAAVRIEPDYVDAWTWLASAHSERGIWGIVSPVETAERARTAIARAMALDPDNADVQSVRGNISMVYDWDWAAAEKAIRRSIDIGGGQERHHGQYSSLLQALRRYPEAVVQAEVSRRLDPANPRSYSALGRALYRNREFDRAVEAFGESIRLDPGFLPNYGRLADVYIALGGYDEALSWLERGRVLHGPDRRLGDGFGVAYALAGRDAEAAAVVDDFKRDHAHVNQNAYSIALVETARGHSAEAIRWLNTAADEHSATIWLVNGELKFDALRNEPGFKALLTRLRFP